MKRYQRQIALPDIGVLGQQKLAEAKVLIIGVGGLGCPVLQNLAAAGIGKIGIVDGDIVEETNLHRQFLYTPNDCGKSKVAVAAATALNQNPDVSISEYPVYLTRQNCFLIVSDYDVIVDCTDTIAARYLINDVAVAKGIPMVYASIHGFEGQLSVFNYQNGPTYRCLFPESDRLETIPNCNDTGVLGVLPSFLGAMQANETLKILLNLGEVLSEKLLLYNGLDNSFQFIEIQKNNNLNNQFLVKENEAGLPDFFADDNSLIIDIREEYEEPKLDLGYIKNVPLAKLDEFLRNVDKNQKITLVCQNGSRSGLAADYLMKKGFVNVSNLQNGISALDKMINNGNR
ncbi:MAG: HesA/MoeB/ThiF family protein [Flavobacterium sp.]